MNKEKMMPFTITVQIGPELLQQDYQHVHHARSLIFLEQARLEYLEHIGHSVESLMSKGLFTVVTKIEVSYRREIKEGEIKVSCEPERVRGKIITLKQSLTLANGKEAIRAVVECALLDAKVGRAVALPEEFLKALLPR